MTPKTLFRDFPSQDLEEISQNKYLKDFTTCEIFAAKAGRKASSAFNQGYGEVNVTVGAGNYGYLLSAVDIDSSVSTLVGEDKFPIYEKVNAMITFLYKAIVEQGGDSDFISLKPINILPALLVVPEGQGSLNQIINLNALSESISLLAWLDSVITGPYSITFGNPKVIFPRTKNVYLTADVEPVSVSVNEGEVSFCFDLANAYRAYTRRVSQELKDPNLDILNFNLVFFINLKPGETLGRGIKYYTTIQAIYREQSQPTLGPIF